MRIQCIVPYTYNIHRLNLSTIYIVRVELITGYRRLGVDSRKSANTERKDTCKEEIYIHSKGGLILDFFSQISK